MYTHSCMINGMTLCYSCPVCRYCQTPEETADQRCMTCGSQEVSQFAWCFQAFKYNVLVCKLHFMILLNAWICIVELVDLFNLWQYWLWEICGPACIQVSGEPLFTSSSTVLPFYMLILIAYKTRSSAISGISKRPNTRMLCS